MSSVSTPSPKGLVEHLIVRLLNVLSILQKFPFKSDAVDNAQLMSLFESLTALRDSFTLSGTNEDSFTQSFYNNIHQLSSVVRTAVHSITFALRHVGQAPVVNYWTQFLAIHLHHFLTWTSDAVHICGLLHAELLRMRLVAVDNITKICLPGELIPVGKAGSGTFSDVYYALMPMNFRYPLVAVKRLKLRDSMTGGLHVGDRNLQVAKIRQLKDHELCFLRLLYSQHIVGLAVDDPLLPFDMIVLEPTSCTWKDVLNARPSHIERWFLIIFGIELFHGILILHTNGVIHCDIKPSNIHFLMDLPCLLKIIQV
jgi:hypothetical protein